MPELSQSAIQAKKSRDEVIDKLIKKLMSFKEYEKTHSVCEFRQAFPNIEKQIKHIQEYDEILIREIMELYY